MGGVILSADLGQAADPTALGLIERTPDADVVRWLERPALGTPYPAIVDRMASVAERYDATVVVDATGVGRPVVDLLRPRCPRLVPVLITAGSHAHRDERGFWCVPKSVLISGMQVAMQNQRVRVAPQPLAEVLTREMRTFRMKLGTKGHASYEAWREGDHDDLVLMLAMGLWQSGRMPRALPADPRAALEREADAMREAAFARVRERKARETRQPWRRGP